ncbi:hypothetical protein [Paenibacillus sp. sptzw28]|nr:hypothetical protein [Paenibacillus sp. sptzw28]
MKQQGSGRLKKATTCPAFGRTETNSQPYRPQWDSASSNVQLFV